MAPRNLDEAVEFIALHSQAEAQRLLDDALAAAESLDILSERGRIVPESEVYSIREIFVRQHRLIYEVGELEVSILAFVHGARDLRRWLRLP